MNIFHILCFYRWLSTGKYSLNFCKIYRLENHSKSSIYLAEFQLYLDDNECELMKFANNTEVRKCHANAICSNTIGSYICKCKDGFTGDGFYCNGKIFGRIKFRIFAFLPTHSLQVFYNFYKIFYNYWIAQKLERYTGIVRNSITSMGGDV